MSTPIDALGDELKRRMENPFWGSFIISWLLINWKVVYITLSWSSKEIDDKIKYIERLYAFSSFFEGLLSIAHLFLFPLIASAIATGVIPYMARIYLKAQVFHKEKDNLERREWIKNKKELLKEEKELIEKKNDIQKLKSESDIWDEEYSALAESGIIPGLVDFIFGKNGIRYDRRGNETISTYYFATFITAGLIEESENGYLLTNKGKYMVQKYPMDKLKDQLEPEHPF